MSAPTPPPVASIAKSFSVLITEHARKAFSTIADRSVEIPAIPTAVSKANLPIGDTDADWRAHHREAFAFAG